MKEEGDSLCQPLLTGLLLLVRKVPVCSRKGSLLGAGALLRTAAQQVRLDRSSHHPLWRRAQALPTHCAG